MIILAGERVMIRDEPEVIEDLDKRGYGERNGNELLLAPEEAMYMKDKKKEFSVKSLQGKDLSFEDLMKKFSKVDKEFARKYLVYRDLKDRGFCVRTGFKWGTHYRVYSRGDRPGQGHAIWLIHVVPEDYTCDFSVLSRSVRLAQNVRKKMIYAVVDKEAMITYYRIDRITP